MDVENTLKISVFNGISSAEIELFFQQTPYAVHQYRPEEYIVMRGDPCRSLYLLLNGTVRAGMISAKGKELTVEDIQAPDMLAPAIVYSSHSEFPVNVQALTNCEVCILNKAGFLRLMQQNSTVLNNFLSIISDRCLFLGQKVNTFALQNLKERLVAELLGSPLQTTQQQLADKLGVARPSLARMIAELVDEGSIKIVNRTLVVIDKNKLQRYL
jgi:CRP-like cAMP-binding protein